MAKKTTSIGLSGSGIPAALARGAGDGAASAAADVTAGVVRLVPPWLAVGALPGAGYGCHVLWGDSPWATVGMTLTTVGLSALSWHVSHARRLFGRLHTTLNVAGACAWVTAVSIDGLHRPLVNAWLLAGFTGAAAWNLRHRLHGPDESGDILSTWWASKREKAALEGSTMRTVEVGEDRGIARLELADGQTIDDAIRNREVVAGMARVPANGIRIQEDPDNARIANVTFVRRDLLREVTPWTGPTHVGGLPTDPHELGTYEDGLRLEITLVATRDKTTGAETNSYQLGIGGMNGAGKSGPVLILVGDQLCRREGLVFVIDCTKREQTWGQMQDLLHLVAYDVKYARRLLKAIKDRLAPQVAKYLGDRGMKTWEPGCGIPNVLLVIEEANLLPDDMKEMIVELLRMLRSLGFNMTVSGQRWTYDGMPTSARAELGGALQFGCADGDAGYLLGDLVDQGANPESWGNRHPGRTYAKVPDVPDERHLIPLRIDHASPAAAARLVRPHVVPNQVPQMFIDALGDVWTDRPVFDGPATADTDTDSTSPEGWTPAMQHDNGGGFEADADAFDPAELGLEPDEDPDIQPGPDDEVPVITMVLPAPPPPKQPDQVRRDLARLLEAWPPGTEFGPSDLVRAMPENAARHRTTLGRILAGWAEDGRLEPVEGTRVGRYRIPTRTHTGGYAA